MKRSKADWRRELLAERAAIPEAERRRASLAMLAHVRALPCVAASRSVVGYVPIGAEADVTPFLAEAVAARLPVFVPASEPCDDRSSWIAWHDGSAVGERIGAPNLQYPAIVLVPGVAFDDEGTRLGRGRGFYDRALSGLRRAGVTHAIGIAFECQIVARLPRDSWDEPVDLIVSDARVIAADAAKRSRREVSACS